MMMISIQFSRGQTSGQRTHFMQYSVCLEEQSWQKAGSALADKTVSAELDVCYMRVCVCCPDRWILHLAHPGLAFIKSSSPLDGLPQPPLT